jgi:hypothetical protein
MARAAASCPEQGTDCTGDAPRGTPIHCRPRYISEVDGVLSKW